ncbi:hypothetical protein Cycma_1382 [Cyclobacterium marinum DSM 745]|uniref:Uncharacterized protein n=1 Tax=Cyclobacterium marinum (strain ATCC 25205 / DSM 745 / LMG 13164 / NCIMB 1802) TaxID=880070 RepID=G0J279_CYCMS|nr:hypothetical protein Cycma_1382 [Cyclobacterium marinum DSM 745]
MALKTKNCLRPFRPSFFLFSQGVIHFALRFTYSLDFFGSFLDQAKNEQVEIRITIGESDSVNIIAKKKQHHAKIVSYFFLTIDIHP